MSFLVDSNRAKKKGADGTHQRKYKTRLIMVKINPHYFEVVFVVVDDVDLWWI